MVTRTMALLSIILLFSGTGWTESAGDYDLISAAALQDRIKAGSSTLIIDICPVEQFAQGHIKGSLETNAYPVKTKKEKARLAELLPQIKASADPVVIVCPRGAGGAKRAVDFYRSKGVEKSRLLILEKGMQDWPYDTEKK